MSKSPSQQQQQQQEQQQVDASTSNSAATAHRKPWQKYRGHSTSSRGRGSNIRYQGRANNQASQSAGVRRMYEHDSSNATLQKRLQLPREGQKYKHQRQLPYAASLAEDVFNNSAIHSNFQKNGCEADLFSAHSYWESVIKVNCSLEDFIELLSPQALVSPNTSHIIQVLLLQAQAPEFVAHKRRFFESGLEFISKRAQLQTVEAVSMLYISSKAFATMQQHEQLARNALLYCLFDMVKQQPIPAALLKALEQVAATSFPPGFSTVFNMSWSKGQVSAMQNMVLMLNSEDTVRARSVPHVSLGNNHCVLFINTASLKDFQLKYLKDTMFVYFGKAITRFNMVFGKLFHHHCMPLVLQIAQGKRLERCDMALQMASLALVASRTAEKIDEQFNPFTIPNIHTLESLVLSLKQRFKSNNQLLDLSTTELVSVEFNVEMISTLLALVEKVLNLNMNDCQVLEAKFFATPNSVTNTVGASASGSGASASIAGAEGNSSVPASGSSASASGSGASSGSRGSFVVNNITDDEEDDFNMLRPSKYSSVYKQQQQQQQQHKQ